MGLKAAMKNKMNFHDSTHTELEEWSYHLGRGYCRGFEYRLAVEGEADSEGFVRYLKMGTKI